MPIDELKLMKKNSQFRDDIGLATEYIHEFIEL